MVVSVQARCLVCSFDRRSFFATDADAANFRLYGHIAPPPMTEPAGMEVDIGVRRVTLSCSSSALLGGNVLTITLVDDWSLQDPHTQLLLKFVGSSLEKSIIANVLGPHVACIDIPAWERPEEVTVQVMLSKTVGDTDGQSVCIDTALAVLPFSYCSNQVQDAALYLLSNAHKECHLCDIHSLESLGLQSKDSTKLDLALTHAFSQLPLPDGWTVLGDCSESRDASSPRETLLHVAARLGLFALAQHIIMRMPGGHDAVYVSNKSGLLPADVAQSTSHSEVAQLINRYIDQQALLANCTTPDSEPMNSCIDATTLSESTTCPGVTQQIHSLCDKLRAETLLSTGSSYDHVPMLTESKERPQPGLPADADEGCESTAVVRSKALHADEPLNRAIIELQSNIRDIEDYKYRVSDAQVQRKGQLSRYSTSCPSLDSSWADNVVHGRYKSMLSATKEEDEDFSQPTDSPKLRGENLRGHERPRSLDSLGSTIRSSKLAAVITLSGVTQDSSAVGSVADSGSDNAAAVEQLRQVSRNMFGGAQQQKSLFHIGMLTAESRSFSLGSLGSEDESEGCQAEASSDATGNRKQSNLPHQDVPLLRRADDGSTPTLQARPQSYGGIGTKLPLSRNSSSQSAHANSEDLAAHIIRARTSSTLLTSSTNLNKSKSVSTPSIRADLSVDHPRLLLEGSLSNCEALLEEDTPTSFPDEDIRKKQSGARRLSMALSKLGSQRKSKDVKRSLHNFVPIPPSPSTCDACGRYLNGSKAVVQCSNCLVNLHDECREKASPCSKTKTNRKTSRAPALVSSLAATTTSKPNQELKDTVCSLQETNSASMESLVDCSNEEFEVDPELVGTSPEPESWSDTIDKKLLKKLNAKYIQRQDNIFEFIASERQYLRTLKMVQKVFVTGMIKHCKYSEKEVEKLFPGIANLVDVHQTFLSRLQTRQDERADKSIDVIGDIVLQQFDELMGERMKDVYGLFVGRQREALEHYKNKMKTDRTFQEFIKNCSANPNTRRRGVQDLITIVTQRMTKYKTLLEQIIKNTKDAKDKADKENLSKALECNKRILEHIDEAIETRSKELRLIEIYTRMDVRAVARYDKTKAFRKSDFLAKGRKLRHEGIVAWRNAREKEVETLVVLLSDVVVFLQDSPQKYTFFSQDNKASVIPLSKLLVREKGSTKDNRGIYLIRQSRDDPEMIELVCRSANERREWIEELREATKACPEEDESAAMETAEEGREALEKLAKVNELVESLKTKDDELEALCKQRFQLLSDLFTVYGQTDICDQIQSGYNEDGEFLQAIDLITFALTEVSRLSSTYAAFPPLSPTGNNLGRSWSSVGEHQSPGNNAPQIPKRSDTFGGFEQGGRNIVTGTVVVRQKAGQSSLLPGGSASSQDLRPSHDGDSSGIKDVHGLVDVRDSGGSVKKVLPAAGQQQPGDRSSASLMQMMAASGSSGSGQQIDLAGLTASAGHGESLVALSNIASVTALIAPSREQLMCLGQLSEYLQALLLITNKQDTTIESYKQQLAEALLRMNKLNQEVEKVSTEKRSAFRHNKQMEEIRNLHELVSKERQQMEADKDKWRRRQNDEQQRLDELRQECEQQQEELRREREELQRQRDVLQKQIDVHGAVQGRLAPSAPLRGAAAAVAARPTEVSGKAPTQAGQLGVSSADGGSRGSSAVSAVHSRSRSADILGHGGAGVPAGGHQAAASPASYQRELPPSATQSSTADALLAAARDAAAADGAAFSRERSVPSGGGHVQVGMAVRPRSAHPGTGVTSSAGGSFATSFAAQPADAVVDGMSSPAREALRGSAAASAEGGVTAKTFPNRSGVPVSKHDTQDIIYF